MLVKEAEQLLAFVADVTTSPQEWGPVAGRFFKAAGSADATGRLQAIRILAKGLHFDDPERIAFIALVCGAMVERGTEPTPMIQPLLTRLGQIVPQAVKFDQACTEAIPADAEDHEAQFQTNRNIFSASMPDEETAWELLQKLYAPMIAMFSASAEARQQARGLIADLNRLERNHQGAFWIAKMLRVLDQEPYVAIDVSSITGVEGRMSGIAENFQLNVLLMDGFPSGGFLGKRRVSKSAADIARGIGDQQSDEILTGCWNLYTWRALSANQRLPDLKDYSGQAHWIWNEGTPADIPTFEGRRVILLGPPSYARSWKSQRSYAALKAELTIDKKLSKPEVHTWLRKIAIAVS